MMIDALLIIHSSQKAELRIKYNINKYQNTNVHTNLNSYVRMPNRVRVSGLVTAVTDLKEI